MIVGLVTHCTWCCMSMDLKKSPSEQIFGLGPRRRVTSINIKKLIATNAQASNSCMCCVISKRSELSSKSWKEFCVFFMMTRKVVLLSITGSAIPKGFVWSNGHLWFGNHVVFGILNICVSEKRAYSVLCATLFWPRWRDSSCLGDSHSLLASDSM